MKLESKASRAAVALAALRSAEERTGATSVVSRSTSAPSRTAHAHARRHAVAQPAHAYAQPAHASLFDVESQSASESRPASAHPALRQAPALADEHADLPSALLANVPSARADKLAFDSAARPPLGVPSQLHDLLHGGLRRGTVLQVTGSGALMLDMVAAAGDLWVAIIGDPLVGVLAAAEMGVNLTKLILVPEPGPDAALAAAALLDGVDILVVGPRAGLAPSDRRRLTARARERGTVILATTPWQGAHTVLSVTGVRWRGIGAGSGRLQARELTVERTGRGESAQCARVEITLPFSQAPLAEPNPLAVPLPAQVPATATVPVPIAPLRLVG